MCIYTLGNFWCLYGHLRRLYGHLTENTEKAMTPHSSTLAWKIPWTEGPGGLLSVGSHRVGHNWSDLAAAAAATDVGYQFRGSSFSFTEKAMTPHSSTLAWKIPWTEEPSRLQSMGSRRVGHDWVASVSLFAYMHWRRKWQPTPVFLPGESQARGSLVGCRLWVAQSQTRLKWLSSSSSSNWCGLSI